MFQKLTTIVDCKLARKIEEDSESEILSSSGFKVCMELASLVVYAALDHAFERLALINRELEEGMFCMDRGRFLFDHAHILNRFQISDGFGFRRALREAHRVEAVISVSSTGAKIFGWKLILFKKGEKEGYHFVNTQITFEGRMLQLHTSAA